jgi:hypothetical protein
MRFLRQSMDVAENVAHYPAPADVLREFGYVALENGNFPEAKRYFRQVVERVEKYRVSLYQVEMLQCWAELAIAEDDLSTASNIIALMIHHPSSRQIVRDNGRRLMTTIAERLDPEPRNQLELGTDLISLESIIAQIISS